MLEPGSGKWRTYDEGLFMPRRGADAPKPLKPSLFIGSSTEGMPFAEAAQEELSRSAEVVRWDQGNFKPGWNTLGSLIEIGRSYDFVMLIATGDDVVRVRGRQTSAVRDNLLFEFGLFIGLLSQDRVFYVYDDDAKPRIPSDLAGQTHLSFTRLRDPAIHGDRDRAAMGPACSQIRKAIEKKGKRFHWLDPDKAITEELPPEVLSLKLMDNRDPRVAKPLKDRAPTVLMIEDHFRSSSSMASLLYMFDFHVINCYDGKVGLEQALARRPDIIILDRQLPSLDGLAVCKALKGTGAAKTIPLIMLSGYTEPDDEVAALRAGVDDFIGKPCDVRVLVQRMKKLLNMQED